MVKFSTVELVTPSSSSSLLHQGLGLKVPSSSPMVLQQNEKEEIGPEPATWTAFEEAILVHLMVKEVRKGNKQKPTFSKRAWKNIELGFYEKTKKRLTLFQLKNKFHTLKARYTDFSKLLKEPGFSWNPVLGRATATDDVWNAYVQANKKARRFRKRGCPLYNELGVIYGDQMVVCQNTTQSIQCSLDCEFKDGAEDESTKSSQSGCAKDGIDREELYATLRAGLLPQQSLPLDDQIQVEMDATAAVACLPVKGSAECALPFAASKNCLAEVCCPKTPNPSHDGPKCSSSSFSITSCVKCLECIQGVDSTTYLKAVKMFKDVDCREMFMAMSAERRLDWLASLE